MTETNDNLLKNQAREAATARLKAAHEDEFAGYMHEEHAARGVTWNPRLTPEQKARKEIERLAKEFGIPLAFDVQSTADAVANVDIKQAAYEPKVEEPSREDDRLAALEDTDVEREPTALAGTVTDNEPAF